MKLSLQQAAERLGKPAGATRPPMSDRSSRAPLFVDALALSQWLIERFDASAAPLDTRLVSQALDLLEA